MTDTAPDAPMFGDTAFGATALDPGERVSFLRIARALQAAGADLDDEAISAAAAGAPFAIGATGRVPDVADGEIIESAWGNAIRDRTVAPFATGADANTAGGPPGALATLLDRSTLYQRVGTAWLPIGGAVASSSMIDGAVGAALTAIAGAKTIATVSLPVAPFARTAIVMGITRIDNETAAAGLMGCRLEMGSTLVQQLQQVPATASYVLPFSLFYVMNIAAGAAVPGVNMVGFRQSGTCTGKTYADGTFSRLNIFAWATPAPS